jgi:hypothetical protein
MLSRQGDGSQSNKGQTGEKLCLLTTDTQGIATKPPEKKLIWLIILQMASEQTLPVLKEALVEVILGRQPLTTWVSFAKMSGKYILA